MHEILLRNAHNSCGIFAAIFVMLLGSASEPQERSSELNYLHKNDYLSRKGFPLCTKLSLSSLSKMAECFEGPKT